MKVRTRIAPSPTGSPHVGTAYQALIDYAFAKKHEGRFIIRLEDTDQKRFVSGGEEEVYTALDWLGIKPDESPKLGGSFGPYRQSERLDLYKKYALELVEKDKAYFCFCGEDRLEKIRQEQEAKKLPPRYDGLCRKLNPTEAKKRFGGGERAVVRLKVPKNGTTTVEDTIRGKIEFKNEELDDAVLLKSDGFPTYHLAIAVDDHLMEVTHPVRGEEWIPSYPKHKLIYEALGWEMPIYTHTPLLRGSKHEKLGKRFGHSSLNWYLKEGILPEALLNYLALLGWSHPEEKEFFTMGEYIKAFDLKDLSAVGPVFDLTKLTWLNGEWMRYLDDATIYKHLLEFDPTSATRNKNLLLKIIPLVKERMRTLKEFYPLTRFFFEEVKWEEGFSEVQKKILARARDTLATIDDWKTDGIQKALLDLYEKEFSSLKKGDFFEPLRWAITSSKISPPLAESLEILGKDKTLGRLSLRIQPRRL